MLVHDGAAFTSRVVGLSCTPVGVVKRASFVSPSKILLSDDGIKVTNPDLSSVQALNHAVDLVLLSLRVD
jgi:hypothetical protein